MWCVGTRPQSHIIFKNFMILLVSSNDSGENEVLFIRITARVPDLWQDMSSGPKWPNCSF